MYILFKRRLHERLRYIEVETWQANLVPAADEIVTEADACIGHVGS